VRRHAMAPSAGSTSGIGNSRSLFGRAFATRGASSGGDGSGARSQRASIFALAFLAAAILTALFAIPAQGAVKAKLAEIGAPTGNAAGKLNNPQGIAVNLTGAGAADPGDFYVADRSNHRISQFTANGTFIRAFGFGVVASGPGNVSPISAVQSVNVPSSVTGGVFTLSFNGQSTGGSGTGSLTEGTNTVSGLTTAKGTGALTVNSPTVTGLATTVGKFIVGQPIAGTGIPAGATIINVSGTTLTLSANATASGAGVALTSGGPRPFAVGQTVTGTGIPAGTTIIAASAGSLTLSANVEAGAGIGVEVALKSGLAFNSTAAQVQTALLGLASIGAGNATVTGGPGATAAYTVTFAGLLKELPVSLLSADSTNLSGGVATVSSTTVGVSPFEICQAGVDTCQIGTASTAAGGVNNPMAVAIDQSTGNVYVNGNPNRRIDVYGADGKFQGAFGVGVRQGDSAPFGLDFCTAATGCLVGQDTAVAGAIKSSGLSRTLTVDAGGNIYVPNPGSQRLDVFSPTLNGSSEVIGASFVRGIGWDVIPAGGPGNVGTELEVCTVASTCQAGIAISPFNGNGQFPAGGGGLEGIGGVAVDSGGFIYTATFKASGNCTVAAPCRVQKFNPDGTFKELFGPASGSCQLNYTSNEVAMNQQPIAVAVDPTNQHVFVLKKTASTGARVCEFDSAGNFDGTSISPLANLTVDSAQGAGLALGTAERVYLANRAPALYILGPVPPPVAEILPASAIGSTTATLNGKVTVPAPGGEGFDTKYHFEYSGDNGFHWKSIPTTDASAGSIAGPVMVSQAVTGLQPNLNYLARLVATTSTSVTTLPAQFTTLSAKPSICCSEALPVAGTTAKLNARVNPNNSPTTYHFQWGETVAYGHEAPDFDPFAGAGGQPLSVSASVSGLKLSTTYHFRLVATNAAGTSFGPDTTFETIDFEGLNAQGLPINRGYELVSPPDKRPQGAVETIAPELIAFQAAADGDSYAYPIIGGLADSTAGGHVEYLAERSASSWESTQVSAPSLIPMPIPSGSSRVWPSTPQYLSDDLSCIVLETPNPLTDDTLPAAVELGITNLYLRNPDGSYSLITNRVPTNPDLISSPGTYYSVAGASEDCKRIFFKSDYTFLPGAPSHLYEWEETGAGGVMRDVGLRPDGSAPGSKGVGFGGAVGVSAVLSQLNSVSPDGRTFFSTISNEGKDSGKRAVYMREADGTVIDISQSQTAEEAKGARYETASPDGSHVFFAGSYRRTSGSSNGPIGECAPLDAPLVIGAGAACGLYDYEVENKETGLPKLTELTATTDPTNPQGAAVEGVVAVDQDGSHVYFAAVGQLVSEIGSTYTQNNASSTVNIYLSAFGALSYVTTIPEKDLARGQASGPVANSVGGNLMRSPGSWTAQTTPDGSRLLFTTSGNITGYESEGAQEAYLYSTHSGQIACVSCRPDGASSVASDDAEPIRSALSYRQASNVVPRSLSKDGSQVFFTMPDALAPGATEGQRNLYEWRKGAVHWLATFSGGGSLFIGASADGEDVFITTQDQLDPHDTDFVRDVYDLRVGGGFAPPPPASVPCDPAAGQCQGPVTPGPGASAPASESVTGPGNPPVPKPGCKKGSVRKHGKCVKKQQGKAQGKRAHRRAANHNRGGAK